MTREDLHGSGYSNDFLGKAQRYDHEHRNGQAGFVKIKWFASIMVLPGEQEYIPQTGIEHVEEAHLIRAQNLHASQGGSLVISMLSTQPCVPEFNPWDPCIRKGVVACICNSIVGVAELGKSQWHGTSQPSYLVSSRFSETSSQ